MDYLERGREPVLRVAEAEIYHGRVFRFSGSAGLSVDEKRA